MYLLMYAYASCVCVWCVALSRCGLLPEEIRELYIKNYPSRMQTRFDIQTFTRFVYAKYFRASHVRYCPIRTIRAFTFSMLSWAHVLAMPILWLLFSRALTEKQYIPNEKHIKASKVPSSVYIDEINSPLRMWCKAQASCMHTSM